MAFNIQTFADNISQYGTLQTNKFEVRIFPRNVGPSGLIDIFEYMKTYKNLDEFERNSFETGYILHNNRIDSVKLPGIISDTIETRRYGVGPVIRTTTNVKFEPISISVISDKDFNLYKFFYTWFSTTFDFNGNSYRSSVPTYLTEYKEYYYTSLLVNVYDNVGESPKNVYRFNEAFPTGLSEPSLSWSNNNSLYKFYVTFSYTNWEMNNKPLTS